jgi:hypothetical protein
MAFTQIKVIGKNLADGSNVSALPTTVQPLSGVLRTYSPRRR